MRRQLKIAPFFLFAFLLQASSLLSQNEQYIDSLEQAFKDSKTSTQKIESWNLLYRHFLNSDYEKSKYYNDWLLEYAKSSKSDSAFYNYYMYQANLERLRGNLSESIELAHKAKNKAKKLESTKYLQVYHRLLSTVYIFRDQPDSALVHIDKNIGLAKIINDTITLADSYFTKAHFYGRFGDMSQSLQIYLVADSLYSMRGKPDMNHASVMSNIGTIFLEQNDLVKAEEYFSKAAKMYKEANNTFGQNLILFRKAELYFKKDDYKKTRKYLDSSYSFFEDNSIVFRLIDINTLYGNSYIKEKEYSKALPYLTLSKEMSISISDTSKMASTSHALGKALAGVNRNSEAEETLKNALKYSQSSKLLIESAAITKTLADFFENNNNFRDALLYLKIHESLKDSLQNQQNRAEVAKLETQYQTQQKEQEIAFLNAQNELTIQKNRNQRNFYLSLLGLAIAIGFVVFYSYRKRLQTAQKIQELDQLKTRFFNNISHEFRTPLTLIKSPLQGLQKDENEPERKKKLKLIDQNTNRLLQLVEQLLNLSKLENNTVQFLFKNTFLNTYLESIIEPFTYQAQEKNISFQTTVDANQNGWIDHDVLEKIMSNLLGNALKYTPENQTILFQANCEGDFLNFKVENTGVVLKSNNLNLLFNRFYQEENNAGGAGIGLALTKELIEEINGKIIPHYADNTLSFEVTLPISKEKLQKANMVFIEDESDKLLHQIQNTQDEEKQLLLIVDDNPAVCSVISDVFKNDFKILTAHDGKDAFDKAHTHIPDIIITDVMMPVMDGFALTSALKENELTSFIPVVLLTAKTDDESRLQGIKNKADAFLSKPFNNDILYETIVQILDSRKQLQERYSQELILKPLPIDVPDLDKEFIEKAQKILEIQLSNSEFTADDLASQMAVSRMQLHRKLKSITGLSSLEYIKIYRLQTAKLLLSSSKLQVAEVAYSVGFNNAKYFSKCYKEFFGTLPSQK